MNAVEIDEAISQLTEQPFDPESFPYAFLEAFANKATTIKRLKAVPRTPQISKAESSSAVTSISQSAKKVRSARHSC